MFGLSLRRRSVGSSLSVGAFVVSLAVGVGCSKQAELRPLVAAPLVREAAKGGAPVHTELLRVTVTFHEDGTYERKEEHRYRILDKSGVENWGHVYAHFSPWYMHPPKIEARVINGQKPSPLDPKALTLQPAYPDAPDIYGDSRVVRGPLPSVRVGSIIEETVITSTHKPFLAPNSLHYVTFASSIPKDKVELIVDAPITMKVNFEVRDAKVTRSEKTEGGRRIVTMTGGPSAALDPPESDIPSELPYWPAVAFSTGVDWHRLAGIYSKIVEDRLTGIDFDSIVSEVVLPGDTDETKLAKLHAWVKARVRYIGVEFGESSVIPYASDEVVSRGFGDCKDQATLLVGLLRAAGFEAHVALLRAGTGEDIIASLPSLDVFNHAIVHVGGKSPTWIDPTADFLPLGGLPTGDQDRFALVASPSTSNVVKTTASTSAQNTYVEKRTVMLAEHGEAEVVELTRATGVLDMSLRSTFARSVEDVRESIEDYVEGVYQSEELGEVTHGDPSALLVPFESTIRAKNAKVGQTGLLQASAQLAEGVVLNWIPQALREAEEKDEKRKAEMALDLPYTADLTWTVKPPEGFIPLEKPDPIERKLGVSQLVRTVETGTDGSVTMRTRFDSGKRRLSAKEVESFREAYAVWAQSRMPYATFEHRSQKLVRSGDVAGGVRLLQDDLKKAPKAAIARLRLAETLEDFVYDAAAAEARAVAESGLDDSELQMQVAHLLARNRLGEDMGKGFDRARALAAYQKAAALDDENLYAKLRQAVVLETHPDGDRYFAPQADLEKALGIYASIPAKELREFDDGGFKNNALVTLFWAGKYEELRSRFKEMPIEEVPLSLALMNEAARVGTSTAVLEEAERLNLEDEELSQALEHAARTLASNRKYDESAKLVQAAMAATKNPDRLQSRLAVLRRSKPVTLRELPTGTPEEVAIKVLVYSLTANEFEFDFVKQYLAQGALLANRKSLVPEKLQKMRVDRNPLSLREAVLADMFYGAMHATKEGSDQVGYRVKITQETDGDGIKHTFFVVKENGKYKVRAIGAGSSEMGAQALAAVASGNEAAAKKWLDWARESFDRYAEKEPLRELPFVLAWAGPDGRRKGDFGVKVAAALLAVESDSAEKALPIVTTALGKEKDDALRVVLLHAQNQIYHHLENYDGALKSADALVKELPDSDPAFWKRMNALWNLRRYKDYEAGIRARLDKKVESERVGLTRSLASALVAQDKIAEGMKVRARLIEKREARSGDYNDQAWDGIFVGVTQEHLDHALRSVEGSKDASNLHTLAAVYAELGKLNDAARTMRELINMRKDDEPESVDHYVLGRIAEQLGYDDVARAEYQKVEKPERPWATATYELAQRRLQKL